MWARPEAGIRTATELGGGFEDRRQVHADFFGAAAGHECDPIFCRIEVVLVRRNLRADGGFGKIREGVADEGRVHAAVAVELFFEGKNDQRFVHIFSQQADASLAPCPELRAT